MFGSSMFGCVSYSRENRMGLKLSLLMVMLCFIGTCVYSAPVSKYCPSSYPYAYSSGKWCCKYGKEKVYQPQGTKCDGSKIQFDSLCCYKDAYLRCKYSSCKSNIPGIKTLMDPVIHLLLQLLRTKVGHHCPTTYPYAYSSGKWCCKYGKEKIYQPQGTKCDGSKIRFNSLCCYKDAYLRCKYSSCKSNITALKPPVKDCGLTRRVDRHTATFGYCPSSYRYAYYSGKWCCKYDKEKIYQPQGTKCDGSKIGFDSLCCYKNAYLKCKFSSCKSNIPASSRVRRATSLFDLNVYTLAVGSGDATVIQCPTDRHHGNGDITIIDMGSSPHYHDYIGMRWEQFDYFIKHHRNRVTRIFLSHPHIDHYNFITPYLASGKTLKDHFPELKYVVVGGDPEKYLFNKQKLGVDVWNLRGKSYDCDYLDGCGFKNKKRYNCIIVHDNLYDSASFDLCSGAAQNRYKLEIIAANYGTINPKTHINSNENSLVMKLTTDQSKSFLFMGDFEGKEKYNILLNDIHGVGTQLKADVMMIPHHGSISNGNNAQDLFNKVKPDNIINSANVNYKLYRHPRCEAIINYGKRQEDRNGHRVDCWNEKNIIETGWFKNVFTTSSDAAKVTANYLRVIKTQMSKPITVDYYCKFNLLPKSTFTCQLPMPR